ncbi:MAG: serine/threonine protein kinase [Coriobacteriales bacterium]|jgi:serine/threonine protein kinase
MQSPAIKIKRGISVTFSPAGSDDELALIVGDEIGRGSMSIVCEGHVDAWGDASAVAVKVLRPSLASSPSAERFMREAVLLCKLSHPNIVRGLGTGSFAGGDGRPEVPFAVLERIDGCPLDELLEQGSYATDPRSALEVLLGISSALGYLHLDGRVQAHRDVKPANIIVRSDGTPKLIDLGVAKTIITAGHSLDTRLAGTVRYMPPEQFADSSRVDVRSDIYALGIVLLEMLGCSREWNDDARDAIAARFDRAPPHLADEDAQRLDLQGAHRHAIDDVLAGMCAYEPHERYQTPRELTRALQEALETLDKPAGDGGFGSARANRIKPAIAVALIVLAAGVALGVTGRSTIEGGAGKAQPPTGHEIIVE